MNWRTKVFEFLALVLGAVIVARVVLSQLGPRLPAIVALVIVATLVARLVRGPHAKN